MCSASPLQLVRDIFDLMPHDSEAHWHTFAVRMSRIPTALEGYQQSLLSARERGLVSPRRQVIACAEQARDLTADDGYFATLLTRAETADGPLEGNVKAELAAAAKAASAAYSEMADWLERELLPHAPEADACGRERYTLESRSFLGATVDLEETYVWGQREVAQPPRPDDRDRGGPRAGCKRRESSRDPRRRPDVPAARHGRAQGVDAGARGRGDPQSQGRPLRHPRAGPADRVHDRSHADRRHLLHRPERRLQPTRADVVERPQGQDRVPDVERADDRLPRGRPRPPPADRADGLPVRVAQQVAPPRVVHVRATPRAGRSTRSASWPSSATWTIRATAWVGLGDSPFGLRASSSTSACTVASRRPRRSAAGRGTTTRRGRT